MARVVLDRDRCEGHGMCEHAAPEVFQVDEDGELHMRHETIRPEQVPAVEAAVRVCPVAALRLQP